MRERPRRNFVMHGNQPQRAGIRRILAGTVAAGLLALGSAGCGSSSSTSSTSASTATFAEPPATIPNYVFPMFTPSDWILNNTNQFENLLYPPLYFFGNGLDPTLNLSQSMAYAPVFSDGNREVTITLKPYKWSDGKPVTTRDIEFWINLLRANKTDYGQYVPGDFPDDVTSVDYVSPTKFTMHLAAAYNPTWFTFTALSEITPIPQHVWDRTSATSPIGNYDLTTSGAHAVWRYINKQSSDVSAYNTSPLWQVVDGAWKLDKISVDGTLTLKRNTSYSGPDKPKLQTVTELPFTSDTSEFDALRSGAVEYGYLPPQDSNQVSYFKSHGYTVVPWTLWGSAFLELNYTNPTVGPIIKQQYFRQAMQMLVDQPAIDSAIYKGYAWPSYGPVPTDPTTSFISSAESHNPYPYDPSKAIALLHAHGWKSGPGGVDVCSSGSACGAGISTGQKLQLSALYPTGYTQITEEMSAIKSSFSKAGIDLGITAEPIGTILSDAHPCTKSTRSTPACSWEMAQETFWVYGPQAYPDGGSLYGTGAASNEGGYSNSTMDALIRASHFGTGVSAIYPYENFAAKQVVSLWIPMTYWQISVISNKLHGAVPQNPLGTISPQDWSVSK